MCLSTIVLRFYFISDLKSEYIFKLGPLQVFDKTVRMHVYVYVRVHVKNYETKILSRTYTKLLVFTVYHVNMSI